MAETEIPETYIDDIELAWEVAHASKDQRAQLAGQQLAEAIILEITGEDAVSENHEEHSGSLATKARIVEGLAGMMSVHPEKMDGILNTKKYSEEHAIKLIPEVLKRGGLPLEQYEMGAYRHISKAELEQEAELRERVAEAIIFSPPSDDFISEHGLHKTLKPNTRGEWTTLTERVIELQRSADSTREWGERVTRQGLDRVAFAAETDQPVTKRIQTMLTVLEGAGFEMDKRDSGATFNAKIEEVLSAEGATFDDIRLLAIEGYTTAGAILTVEADEKQAAFNAVYGSASQYKKKAETHV